MSRQRYINTKFWDDSYIVNLDPIEKLLFIYFLTNPLTTIAGAYEISIRRIGFDTGIDKDMVLKIIERFTKDNKIIYKDGWLFIINFVKHQAVNEKIQKGIESCLKDIPQYLIDTLSISYDRTSRDLNYVNVNVNVNSNVNDNVNVNLSKEPELCDNTKLKGTVKRWCKLCINRYCPDKSFKQCMEWFNEFNKVFLNYIVHEKKTVTREQFMAWRNRNNKDYDKTLWPIWGNQVKNWMEKEHAMPQRSRDHRNKETSFETQKAT
jgi:hypothetical protein